MLLQSTQISQLMPIALSDPPLPPKNVHVTGSDVDHITVAWDLPEFDGGSKITAYIVELKASKEKKYRALETLGKNAREYTAKGLTKGESYRLRVRAKNKAGTGDPGELEEAVVAKLPYGEKTHIVKCFDFDIIL